MDDFIFKSMALFNKSAMLWPIFLEIMGTILAKTSGLISASITLSDIEEDFLAEFGFLVLLFGARRSSKELALRRRIYLATCFSGAGRSLGLSGLARLFVVGVEGVPVQTQILMQLIKVFQLCLCLHLCPWAQPYFLQTSWVF